MTDGIMAIVDGIHLVDAADFVILAKFLVNEVM